MGSKTKTPLVGLKDAAGIALEYFLDLYPEFRRTAANVMLEEVEEIDDAANWLITIGYDMDRRLVRPTIAFGPPPPERHYKVIKVDAQTGRVISMKIRSLK